MRSSLPAICVILAVLSHAQSLAEVSLASAPDRIELANARQKIEFLKDRSGRFRLSTFVRRNDTWDLLFDGQEPLLQGAEFDLYPGAYKIIESSAGRVAVELSGVQPTHGYAWDLLVELTDATDLVRFRLTCRLAKPLTISGLGPQLVLWMNRSEDLVSVNQGPGNIYHGPADIEWGNSFPAAYLWASGKEAAVFFDMTPVTWMSHRNLFRFRDCRVQAFADHGRTGFGLRVVKRNFHELPAGDLVYEFYLHAAARPERPSRLEALGTLVDTFAPLHPTMAPMPDNHVAPGETRWATFARGVTGNLMLKDLVWDDLPLPEDKPWNDGPAFPERTVSLLRISSDYAVDSACQPQWNRKSVREAWDFSTSNNYLAAWVAYERLHPDPAQHQHLSVKVRDLPLFYDPACQLIRHSTRYPLHVGEREMTWQNLTFNLETVKIYQMLRPGERDPALAGKFLMSLNTLMTFARKVEYVFPQWFDPLRLAGITQQDVPELGMVKEPWQTGTYAYLMCKGFEITGSQVFLDEAKQSIEQLLNGKMRYTIENERYRIEYDDPVDFPITEIFGNAWGVAAAEKVHAWTGESKYRRYSDDFLNSLLRMSYWYESQLRDDPKDRLVRNAGLFRNHAGAFTGSPWETSEAFLALTVRLKHDTNIRAPLLPLFNLYRINSFYFFPAVVPNAALACPKLIEHPASYLPIEDYYMHEHGGENGAMGRAVYMSGIALWNYLLFEAFAKSDDPEVMVLNLDAVEAFDEAAAAVRREFLVYNPTKRDKSTKIKMDHLADARYRLSVFGAGRLSRSYGALTAAELRSGLSCELPPGDYRRILLERDDDEEPRNLVRNERQACDRLACAYQLLQQAAGDRGGFDDQLRSSKAMYLKGLADYLRADYTSAMREAAAAMDEVNMGR
ncbi:MAG TPA: hypothetical protein VG826_00080 [Pirellulales bacterium]|nr:hypothetical protein [Pirellulales bacterium]